MNLTMSRFTKISWPTGPGSSSKFSMHVCHFCSDLLGYWAYRLFIEFKD